MKRSQNPIELEGTYPLPEAQLDRFLFKLAVTKVDVSVLEEIITTRRHGEPPTPSWTLSKEKLSGLFEVVHRIFFSMGYLFWEKGREKRFVDRS